MYGRIILVIIMKKDYLKKYNYLLFSIIILFIVHMPILLKNLLSADILLNNGYYNGYSWEVSLGRFGLYALGLFKAFLSIKELEFFISIILIGIIIYVLINIFEIENTISKVLTSIIICVHPVISATLLFHYCSVGYLLAFLCGILAFYYYLKKDKIVIPIILIIISLSMYQAYLSVIVTVFILYQIKLLLDNKIDYKKSFKYLLVIISGLLLYFILMKLSLLVLNIPSSSYSGANKVGLSLIGNLPRRIIDSYTLFYSFYFGNSIMKNTYIHNNIINLIFFGLLFIRLLSNLFNSKSSNKDKIITIILIVLLPVFLNSIIFVIAEAKMQLLMSSSYLLLFVLFFSLKESNKSYIFVLIIFGLLIHNYIIQDNCTYISLEKAFNKHDTIINTGVLKYLENPNYSFAIVGKYKNKKDYYSKMNYGFISDMGLFWDEYNLRKLGLERYISNYYNLDIKYVSEEEYKSIPISDEYVYIYNDIIVLNIK